LARVTALEFCYSLWLPLKAIADRRGNELRVACPHRGFVNDFVEVNEKYGLVPFELIERFSCCECGKPNNEVGKPAQQAI
jgi:hypothetical protein